MDRLEIQHEIEALPVEEQKSLLDWLSEREDLAWDAQIARDFSFGGRGMELLDQVKAQIENGESKPMARRTPGR